MSLSRPPVPSSMCEEANAVSGGLRTLVWKDREGREEPAGLPAGNYGSASLSPNGRYVALDILDPENTDVWIGELARGTLNKLTTDPANDAQPLWTLDGTRVVFDSDREGPRGLFSKAFDGTAVERLMTLTAADVPFIIPRSWSPDGKSLAFYYGSDGGVNGDIGLLSMNGEPAWEAIFETEISESRPAIAPSGGWIAYASTETGQSEVYVQRFPALGTRRLVSNGGGSSPRWSPDGRELFYTNGPALMVVPVDTDPTFDPGTAQILFEGQEFVGQFGMQFEAVDLDAQRFLMIKGGAAATVGAPAAPIILIQNWHQELLERVPVP